MLKRTMALLVALVMLLCSCAVAEVMTNDEAMAIVRAGGGTTYDLSGKAAVDEECYASLPFADGTEITLWAKHSAANSDFETTWSVLQLEARTGVNLVIKEVESSVWDEQVNIAFASDNYPDIFVSGLSADSANKYGMQGHLIDMSELIAENAPIVSYCFDQLPDVKKSITSTDGSIYYVPQLLFTLTNVTGGVRYFMNRSYIEAVDMSVPTTLDEFYDLLVAVRDNDCDGDGDTTDEIPLYISYEDGFVFDGILSAFGFVDQLYDVIDGEVVFVHAEDNYRYYLEFMAKLYSEGLLNSNYFTLTPEDREATMATDHCLLLYKNAAPYTTVSGDKEIWKKYEAMLGALTSEYSPECNWPQLSNAGAACFAITDHCKDPVTAIKLLNYMFTDENCIITRWGPEKGTVEGYENGGWLWNEETQMYENYGGDQGSWSKFRNKTTMNVPNVLGAGKTNDVFALNETNAWIAACIVQNGYAQYSRLGLPTMTYTDEESYTINSSIVDLKNYVSAQVARFIRGDIEITDETWAEYIAAQNELGLQELLDAQQSAYERWNNN